VRECEQQVGAHAQRRRGALERLAVCHDRLVHLRQFETHVGVRRPCRRVAGVAPQRALKRRCGLLEFARLQESTRLRYALRETSFLPAGHQSPQRPAQEFDQQ
jgi:hypothetical protein